jgi:hypothetical protein
MKRYMTFAGEYYYPSGGMNDFRGSFDTLDEAIGFIEALDYDWMHVWDIVENMEVWSKA